jgi:hypothetical protein
MPQQASAVASMVAREISRQLAKHDKQTEEIKHSISTYTDQNPPYPTAGLTPLVLDARVTIPLGTGSQARVGQRVRLSRYNFSINGWMPYTATVEPCRFRVVIGKVKSSPALIPSGIQLNSIKRSNSSGTSTGIYSSTKVTQLTPYNTDLWQILETRDFKLGLAAPTSGSLANAAPNNDFVLEFQHNFDLMSYIKHDVRFDDSTGASGVQVNDGLFIMIMCLDYNEAVPIATAGNTPRFDAVLDFEYTDA